MIVFDNDAYDNIRRNIVPACLTVFYRLHNHSCALPTAALTWQELSSIISQYGGAGLITKINKIDNDLIAFTGNMHNTCGIPFEAGVVVQGTGVCTYINDIATLVAINPLTEQQTMTAGADAVLVTNIGENK